MQTLSILLWVVAAVNSPDPAAARYAAKYANQAALLFEDGQARLAAGKYGTAALAFQALISVYPESPLVPSAREAMRRSEDLERKQQNARMIRSLRFRLNGVSEEEVLQRFRDREVGVAVEAPCRPNQVLEARAVLVELLAEKGVANPRVKVAVRHHSPQQMDLTFHD